MNFLISGNGRLGKEARKLRRENEFEENGTGATDDVERVLLQIIVNGEGRLEHRWAIEDDRVRDPVYRQNADVVIVAYPADEVDG